MEKLLLEWLVDCPQIQKPAVVCLGFFDGVHRGHVKIVEQAVRQREGQEWQVCVHTYDRAPGSLLESEGGGPELTTLLEKAPLLRQAGADTIAVSRFDLQLLHMTGERFFYDILVKKLQARAVVCGFNHRFGYGGQTDTGALAHLCAAAGVGLYVVDPVKTAGGEVISSSAIRRALQRGNTALAEEMLGRPCPPEMIRRFVSPPTNRQ